MKKIEFEITQKLIKSLKPWTNYISKFAKTVSQIKGDPIIFQYGNNQTKKEENEYQITRNIIKILKDKNRVKAIILAPLHILDNFQNDSDSSQYTKEDLEYLNLLKVDLNILKEDLKTLHEFCTTIKKEENNILSVIFDYKSFRNGYCFNHWEIDGTNISRKHQDESQEENQECYSPKTLYELMDLKACPYCNLEYIPHGDVYRHYFLPKDEYKKKKSDWHENNKIIDNDKGIYTIEQKRSIDWEFDHFYPQSQYPYLAISVYNLIPVCPMCNQRLKLDLPYPKKWYLHPFFDDFHKIAHFEFDFTTPDFLSKPNSTDVKVSLQKNKDIDEDIYKRAQNYCDFFALRDIDPNNDKKGRISLSHSDYLYEIYKKLQEYNKDLLIDLQKQWGVSDEDIMRLIFGNYTSPDDINKRPLAKITIDMIREYGHLLPLKEEEKE